MSATPPRLPAEGQVCGLFDLASGSRQVDPALTAHIGERLGHLRRLDDELGSGDLAQLARAELALIVRLLRDGTYTDQTAQGVGGAYVLSFMAVQCYSTGQARHAVSLLDTAESAAGRSAPPG